MSASLLITLIAVWAILIATIDARVAASRGQSMSCWPMLVIAAALTCAALDASARPLLFVVISAHALLVAAPLALIDRARAFP